MTKATRLTSQQIDQSRSRRPPSGADLAPSGFGGLVHEHRLRPDRLVQLWALPGVVYTAFAAATLLGFYRWYFAYSHYGPAVVWRWASPAWAAAAGLFGLGGILALRAARIARRRLDLYSGGLVWREGRRAIALAWADVVHIFTVGVRYGILGFVWGNRLRVTLVPTRGPRLHFSEDLAAADSLLGAIKHSVYPRLLAEARQAFNAGTPLAFGPLVLLRSGIQRGRRHVPWSGVRSAVLDSGRLQLQIADGDATSCLVIPASRIPNADLCLQLIQNLYAEA